MSYTPQIGGSPDTSFSLQFPNEEVLPESMATCPIYLHSLDGTNKKFRHATGFVANLNDQKYLVTARHVVSGKCPFEDTNLCKQGFMPQTIGVAFGNRDGNTISRTYTQDINLYDANGQGIWFEDHRFEELRTDIAVIPLPKISDDKPQLVSINVQPRTESIVSMIGSEFAVLGYPTSNISGMSTPIYRKGSLASEPRLPIDNKPIFLLDISTADGFSGGPVFRFNNGPTAYRREDGLINMRAASVFNMEFAGVYAGRLTHSHVNGEVPFVFYGNRIKIIIEQQKRTTLTL